MSGRTPSGTNDTPFTAELLEEVMMRASKGLQRRCDELLSELGLPDPFDVDVLLERLAERRQRPLRLLPLMPGLRDEPSGMWVPLADEDVIFAESSVSGWYRDHVVFHEIGHMLWEHLGSVRDVTDWLGQYGVRNAPPTRVAMRCSVTAKQQEQEAEMIAVLIESRISGRRSPERALETTPAEVSEVLNRLALALGSRAGSD